MNAKQWTATLGTALFAKLIFSCWQVGDTATLTKRFGSSELIAFAELSEVPYV